jgi:hypothetical protein
MTGDRAKGSGTDVAAVDRLMDANSNTAPAFESGPHLNDPYIRTAKRAQMKAAGMKLSDPGLTEDMKAILREKE